jgi:hypothetical protein
MSHASWRQSYVDKYTERGMKSIGWTDETAETYRQLTEMRELCVERIEAQVTRMPRAVSVGIGSCVLGGRLRRQTPKFYRKFSRASDPAVRVAEKSADGVTVHNHCERGTVRLHATDSTLRPSECVSMRIAAALLPPCPLEGGTR